jgi:uncharacterized membrane protein YhiD involved in acid resistance
MSPLFSFKQIVKALVNISMLLVCVIVLTLLTTSCGTAPTKKSTLNDATANSSTAKEKSAKKIKADVKEVLECREVESTGSRFKRKVCERKEVWAAIDKKNKKESEELVRTVNDQSGIINPEGKSTSGGIGSYNSPITTPGGY